MYFLGTVGKNHPADTANHLGVVDGFFGYISADSVVRISRCLSLEIEGKLQKSQQNTKAMSVLLKDFVGLFMLTVMSKFVRVCRLQCGGGEDGVKKCQLSVLSR